MATSDLKARLEELELDYQSIEKLPATTLEIIGKSDRERYWEAMLAYFLDPNKPHGFGTAVLESFIEAVVSHPETKIGERLPSPEKVRVRTQVPTSSGPVDMLLWVVEEWFLCIELKVHAAETGNQTVRYSEAPRIGDLKKSNFAGVGEYLYLAPKNTNLSTESPFVELDWEDVIPYLEHVISGDNSAYPGVSCAQLSDFINTIKRELNMAEHTELSEETRLYAEYFDAINTVTKKHHREEKALYERLKDALQAEFDDSDVHWKTKLSGNTKRRSGMRYLQLYKNRWHSLENGTKVEYEPHIHTDRIPPDIRLRLDIESGNHDAVRAEVLDRVGRDTLSEMGWEISMGTYEFIGKSIPLDFDNPDEAIQKSIEELRDLHQLVEDPLDSVAIEIG